MEHNTYKELQWKAPPLDISAAQQVEATLKNNKENILNEQSSLSSTTTERQPINAESTALLVVDVQPEYWSKAPSVRKDFPEFPSNLQHTIQTCRSRKIKTIIFIRADYSYTDSPWLVQFARLRTGRSTDTMIELPCDPSSEEFAWEDFATPEGGEVIIPKTSWSSVSNTALLEHLKSQNVDTVLVCGLITSVCVHHSAFGIFEAGYRTILVSDSCADRGRQRHDAALALYGDYMYEIIQTKDLEDKEKGLIKAEPVWLKLDSTNKNKIIKVRPTTTNSVSHRSVHSSRSNVTPIGENDESRHDQEDVESYNKPPIPKSIGIASTTNLQVTPQMDGMTIKDNNEEEDEDQPLSSSLPSVYKISSGKVGGSDEDTCSMSRSISSTSFPTSIQ